MPTSQSARYLKGIVTAVTEIHSYNANDKLLQISLKGEKEPFTLRLYTHESRPIVGSGVIATVREDNHATGCVVGVPAEVLNKTFD